MGVTALAQEMPDQVGHDELDAFTRKRRLGGFWIGRMPPAIFMFVNTFQTFQP